MSLSTRVSIIVALLLTVAGTATGLALYDSVHRSLKKELNGRVETRLAWLQSAVDLDEAKLDFEAKASSATAAPNWKISTHDGRVLWSSPAAPIEGHAIARTAIVRLGKQDGPPAPGSMLTERKEEQDVSSYQLVEPGKGLELHFWAAVSSESMNSELRRLALAIWTVGPAAVLLLTALLLIFLRRQLAPLVAMSQQAALIGPGNITARIGPAGTSAECVKLREAINRMVERLADGLERERHFASMAAHELRTPLAQLRTNIEVTLRKERESTEYRTALSESLVDVERLQKLVANLLILTRNEEGAAHTQETVPLSKMLGVARKSCPALTVTGIESVDSICVKGNEELLASAVRNVLENASQYAPGSEACIRAERGEVVTLSISDCGPGIPEGDRERIFQPLIRLDAARTIGEAASGFGLGLTVARSAVRACGGDLICRARTDAKPGAEFVFTLKPA